MMFIQPELGLVIRATRHVILTDKEIKHHLTPSNAYAQKQAWLAAVCAGDYPKQPHFTYDYEDTAKFVSRRRHDLLAVKDDLDTVTPLSVEEDVIVRLISDELARSLHDLWLLVSFLKGDLEKTREYSVLRYGQPSVETLMSAQDTLHSPTTSNAERENATIVLLTKYALDGADFLYCGELARRILGRTPMDERNFGRFFDLTLGIFLGHDGGPNIEHYAFTRDWRRYIKH